MATSTEIKQRANALADKPDVNSITPKEVGGIMYDLASHGENVLRNGGTLGIRKVYESVSAMEADSTNPKDFWGDPIKKGNLVVIYDGTTTGVDNNKIYAFMKPGWQIATHLDAGYATKAGLDAAIENVLTSLRNSENALNGSIDSLEETVTENKKEVDEKLAELYGSEIVGFDSKSVRFNTENANQLWQYIDRCFISFDNGENHAILLDYFSWNSYTPNALYFQILISNDDFVNSEVAEIRIFRNNWKKGEYLNGEYKFQSGIKIHYALRANMDFDLSLSNPAQNKSVPILPYQQKQIIMPNGLNAFDLINANRLANICVEKKSMLSGVPKWVLEYKVWSGNDIRLQIIGITWIDGVLYFGLSTENGDVIVQPKFTTPLMPKGIKEYNFSFKGYYFHSVVNWDEYSQNFYSANTGVFAVNNVVGENGWEAYFKDSNISQIRALNYDIESISQLSKIPSWLLEYRFWSNNNTHLQMLGVMLVDGNLFVGVSNESGSVINQPSIYIGNEHRGIQKYDIVSYNYYYHIVVDWDNYVDGFFAANTGIFLSQRPIGENGWHNYFGGQEEVRCKASDNLVKICCENIGGTIVVESGEHDLIEEYKDLLGADYWDNYEGYNSGLVSGQGVGAGIPLMRGTKLICSPNAIIKCHYQGNNPNVRTYFSAFACGNGYEIGGMWLECSGLRYAIHDDFNTTENEYHVTVRNSHIVNSNQAIGGGLGYCGNYLIENNYIESTENWYDMRYHNSAAKSKNRLTFVGNYFAKRLRIANYGISELHTTECFISNNSMADKIIHDNETDEYNVENIKIYEWNNHIR